MHGPMNIKLKYQFHYIRSVEAELYHAGGRLDTRTDSHVSRY
jgi:hypothetical protein